MLRTNRYEEFTPCLYRTDKDLQDRLDNTICRYNGQPVRVHFAAPGLLDLYPVVGKRGVRGPITQISADDPGLDISLLENGYMNWRYDEKLRGKREGFDSENHVFYISGRPSKKYKQGFHASYAVYRKIDGSGNEKIPTEFLVSSQGMHDSILGEFPDVRQTIDEYKSLEPGRSYETAVSRDVALSRTPVGVILVYYRCYMVGWMGPNDSKVTVTNDELQWVVERFLGRLQW